MTSAVCDPVGSMTWAETRALFGLDDVALKGLLSVKQSGSNAIEGTAGIDATFPLPLAAAKVPSQSDLPTFVAVQRGLRPRPWRAAWIEARVTKQARVAAWLSKSSASRRFRSNQ